MRDGLFAAFISAMLVVSLAPRHRAVATPIVKPHFFESELRVQVAWLGQRESAFGDWESVKPPLREGDELQLTVLLSENACVYVFDGDGRQLFPPPGLPPALHANWPYAIPGRIAAGVWTTRSTIPSSSSPLAIRWPTRLWRCNTCRRATRPTLICCCRCATAGGARRPPTRCGRRESSSIAS